jgi:hypothetical protein
MRDVVCPITQEEIRRPIVLRGARFELVAILDVLRVLGPQASHPYERTPFTDAELLNIYIHALHLEPAYLLEQGWMMPSRFFASQRPPQDDADPPPPASLHEVSTCLIVLCMVLIIFFVIYVKVT